MSTTNSPTESSPQPAPTRRGRWKWFAGGFAVVFVALLLFYPVIAMSPSGQTATRHTLASFYASAIPRLFGPSTLGPTSGQSGMLVLVAAQHAAISLIGGCLAAVVGWKLGHRIRK